MSDPDNISMVYHFHAGVQEQAARARAQLKSGEEIDLDEVAYLSMAWQSARHAVAYARRLVASNDELPEIFDLVGSQYLLIFPPKGPVQIAHPLTRQSLTVGLEGVFQLSDNQEEHLEAILEEATCARSHYEETQEPIPLDQVPHLHIGWVIAQQAVQYARKLVATTRELPKRFTFMGNEFLLVFPPEGPVQLVNPLTHENLCVGLPGWVDPQKVLPKT